MPYVYISGKPVFARDDQELRRLIPLADAIPPEPNATVMESKAKQPLTALPPATPLVSSKGRPDFHAAFAVEDPKAQAFLRLLAANGTKPISGEVLRERLRISPRDLAGYGVRLSKRFGKGAVVKTTMERKGKARIYHYKLSPSALAIAKEEGWG